MLFSFASVWFYLTLFINDFFVRLKIVKNVDRTRGVHQSFSQRAIVYDLPILQQALLDENHIIFKRRAARLGMTAIPTPLATTWAMAAKLGSLSRY